MDIGASSFCQKTTIEIDARLLYETRPDALNAIFDVALIETLKEQQGILIGGKPIPYDKVLEKDRLDKILPDSSVHEFKGGVFVYSYHDAKAPVKFVVRETEDLYLFITATRIRDIPHRREEVNAYSREIDQYVNYFKQSYKCPFNLHVNFIVFREIQVPVFDIEDEFTTIYGDAKVIHYKDLKALDGQAIKVKFFE